MAKIKFNVTEITQFGNGGGTKVKMLPSIAQTEEGQALLGNSLVGSIELHMPEDSPFEFGEYEIEFTKVD